MLTILRQLEMSTQQCINSFLSPPVLMHGGLICIVRLWQKIRLEVKSYVAKYWSYDNLGIKVLLERSTICRCGSHQHQVAFLRSFPVIFYDQKVSGIPNHECASITWAQHEEIVALNPLKTQSSVGHSWFEKLITLALIMVEMTMLTNFLYKYGCLRTHFMVIPREGWSDRAHHPSFGMTAINVFRRLSAWHSLVDLCNLWTELLWFCSRLEGLYLSDSHLLLKGKAVTLNTVITLRSVVN